MDRLTWLVVIFCSMVAVIFFALAWGNWPANSEVYRTRVDYPLALDNQWVYSGEFYEGSDAEAVETATYTRTETVVEVLYSETGDVMLYLVMRETKVDTCPEAWEQQADSWCARMATAEPDFVWYAVDKNTFYTLQTPTAFDLSNTGRRELVYPLQAGSRWYLSQIVEELNPEFTDDFMLRRVEATENVEMILMGEETTLRGCQHLSDVINEVTETLTYCPGVGFVKRSTTDSSTHSGSFEELTAYYITE